MDITQVFEATKERNGDPGAIRGRAKLAKRIRREATPRTRDPQLRRLATKSAQVRVVETNFRNAVPIN
jgi:hypothetical protein